MRNRDSLFSILPLASLLLFTPPILAQGQMPSLTAANSVPVAASSEAPSVSGSTSVAPSADTTPHAAVDAFFQPVPAGKLKGIKTKKEKPPKTVHILIEHGVLTVDGWTGKANLNYDIDDFQYFYMWAPGVGTIIVSNHAFPGSKIQYSAFDKNTLTVKMDDHQIQLTSDHRILPGKPKELDAPAYVAIDPNFVPTSSKYPVFGYGLTNKAPYAWPGSLVDLRVNKDAPPLPPGLQPTIQTTTVCPQGSTTTAALDGCRSVPVPMALSKKQEREISQ